MSSYEEISVLRGSTPHGDVSPFVRPTLQTGSRPLSHQQQQHPKTKTQLRDAQPMNVTKLFFSPLVDREGDGGRVSSRAVVRPAKNFAPPSAVAQLAETGRQASGEIIRTDLFEALVWPLRSPRSAPFGNTGDKIQGSYSGRRQEVSTSRDYTRSLLGSASTDGETSPNRNIQPFYR